MTNERVNRFYKKYINPTSIIPEFHSQREIKKNKLTNEDIWDTIKSANLKSRIRGKIKRLNILQFIPRNEYIDKTKLINALHFSNRNKLERYHQYLKTKNNCKKSFERNIYQLQKSKDFIEKKYTKEYKEYIKFLRNKLETEYAIKLQLLNEENKNIFEINKLKKKIENIKNIKKDLIKWLYLQIEVKEKLIKIPEYYKKIIEDNISLSEINKKQKIKINYNEYDRIMNYRGKNVYNDVNDFLKEINNLEANSIFILNNNYELMDEDKAIKNEYIELKKQYMIKINGENAKISELMNDLKNKKKKNIQLKNELLLL